MEYKVIPFIAILDQKKETSNTVAYQLENLIQRQVTDGWTYVRLESVSTYIQPDPGCFGLGAKPSYMSTYQMAVFNKP